MLLGELSRGSGPAESMRHHMSDKEPQDTARETVETRRGLLRNLGKAALAVPPTVTMIMAATSRPAKAKPPYWAPAHGYWRKRNGN